MSILDRKLHRRSMLRWMGFTGVATVLPGPLRPALRAIQESDLPTLTVANPICYTDDDDLLLRMGKYIFEREGWAVIDTPFADVALDICRTQPISLVISDMAKPWMSGLDLLFALRADPATRDTPFIFLSAHAHMRNRVEELGANGFISKPTMPDEMVKAVRGYLLRCGRWQPEVLARFSLM